MPYKTTIPDLVVRTKSDAEAATAATATFQDTIVFPKIYEDAWGSAVSAVVRILSSRGQSHNKSRVDDEHRLSTCTLTRTAH
jgi:hypothetical protein